MRRLAPAAWRAGWAIPFAIAEQGNPRWLLGALERTGRDCLIQFPPQAPFLDPDLTADVITEAERHPGSLARLSTAPPGVAGGVFRKPLLVESARQNLPLDLPMRFQPGRPERSLENKEVFHWFPEEISSFGTRLDAESRRGISVLQGIWKFLGSRGLPGKGDAPGGLIRRLRENPEILAGPIPQEVRFQVTSRVRSSSRLDPGPPGNGYLDLDAGIFRKAASELGAWQECRQVISGGEPFLHPEVGWILRSARSSGAGMVLVETDGGSLNSRALDLLLETTDVVLVAVDAVKPETYRSLKGVDALHEVERGLGGLLERSAAAGGWPAVAVEFRILEENRSEVEPFFDHWYPKTPRVVVREPSHRAGLLPLTSQAARTPERIPCLRIEESLQVLADGRVAACENDFRGSEPVGDLKESSLDEVWTGQRMGKLRTAHSEKKWEELPLCRRCQDWCRR